MFTKRHAFMTGILFILLFTSACGAPAATQAPATQAPASDYHPEEFAATEAPAATQAPSYAPQGPASEAPLAEVPSTGYLPEQSNPGFHPPVPPTQSTTV